MAIEDTKSISISGFNPVDQIMYVLFVYQHNPLSLFEPSLLIGFYQYVAKINIYPVVAEFLLRFQNLADGRDKIILTG